VDDAKSYSPRMRRGGCSLFKSFVGNEKYVFDRSICTKILVCHLNRERVSCIRAHIFVPIERANHIRIRQASYICTRRLKSLRNVSERNAVQLKLMMQDRVTSPFKISCKQLESPGAIWRAKSTVNYIFGAR
jgi:hypothetical protein